MNYITFRITAGSRLLAAAVAALALLSSCAVNPVTGRQDLVLMSEQDELRLGREADAEIRRSHRLYPNPALQRYVDSVGQKLARNSHRSHLQFRFAVLDSPEVNAFALPGGYIYLERGLLAYLNSEAELAAVLGHEIAHVTARHGVQHYSAAQAANIGASLASVFVPALGSHVAQNVLGLFGNALLSGYGREHELEADRLGAEYLARNGYDPNAMIRVIGVLKNQEMFEAEVARAEGRQPRAYHGVFSTHPSADARLQQVVAEAGRLATGTVEDRRSDYMRQIDGLVYGESPADGLVRDNRFIHPELGFALRFPQGWRIANLPDKVLAASAARDAVMELKLLGDRRGSPLATLQATWGSSAVNAESVTVNGLPAAVASIRGRPTRVAVVMLDGRAYALTGSAANEAAFSRHRDVMRDTVASFGRIAADDRALARPRHLRTMVAAANTTYADLARRSGLGKHAENILRLVNDAYPGGEPKPGQLIKTIE